jgi:lactate dehydrogenase-like 2-hydroxyacid dehydrogenase
MKVFITRIIPDPALKLLHDAGCTITQYTEKKEINQTDLITICRQHDALLNVGLAKLDRHFLDECRHLKAISLMSVGYDNVDIAYATSLKIPIGNTPDVLSRATSDVAFLLMLAVSRKAFFHHNRIINGTWGFFEPTANLGIELYGKTIGIFGLGRIGMELAKKCIGAYSMRVIYHNRSRNELAERELGAKSVSFDELLHQSDILSIHANLSTETKGLFNKETFSKMKPSSIFINTARGGFHNESDLIVALQDGLIWGAGLDVTNPEPMSKDNLLLTMPNACVLPHIGSATVEARNAMAKIAAQNVIAALQGNQMQYCVNPEVYS